MEFLLKVKLFIQFCAFCAGFGCLKSISDEDLICLYEECIVIAIFLQDIFTQLIIYKVLAPLYRRIHQTAKAIECQEQCLNIALRIGDRNVAGMVYENLAKDYQSIGQCQKAIEYHKIRLRIAIEEGNRKAEGRIYGDLGSAYYSLRKCQTAIEYYEKDLKIALDINDKEREGAVYGNLGKVYLSTGEHDKGIKYHEKRLDIAKEMNDRKGEGAACGDMGIGLDLSGKHKEAIGFHEKDLNIAKEIGDRKREGRCYGNIGAAYQSLGEYKKAIDYLEESLSIAKETGDKNGEGAANGNLGNVYYLSGDYHKAVQCYKNDLKIALENSNIKGEEAAYGNLGSGYYSLGEYHKAIENHQKCLDIAIKIKDRKGEGSANGNLGNSYYSLGEYYKAVEYYKKWLSIAVEIRDRMGEGLAYKNLGNVCQSLGMYGEALGHSKTHLQIAKEIGDKDGEGAAYGGMGNAYNSLGKHQKAMECHQKYLSIAREIGDKKGEGTALRGIGDALLYLGKHQEAIEYYEKDLTIAFQMQSKWEERVAYGSIGNAYQSLTQYHEAIEYHKKDLNIAEEIDDRRGEGMADYNVGYCYMCEAQTTDHPERILKESENHLKKSIQSFERLFEDLSQQDQYKISIVDTFIHAYKLLALLYIETQRTEDALLVSEHGRARALGDLLILKYSTTKATSSKSGTLEATDIEKAFSARDSCIVFYAASPVSLTACHIWLLSAQDPILFIKSESKEMKPPAKISTMSEDIQKELDEEIITNVVQKSYDMMKVREGMNCEDRCLEILEGEGHGITDTTNTEKLSSRCIIDDEDEDENPLELLFERLIAPVKHKLVQDEIVIVPDGDLYMVPFAALRDPETGQFLSETKAIRLAPSLTTLKVLQESLDHHHIKSGALIVGNPKIGQVKYGGRTTSFTDLPGAEKEAKEIGKLLGVEPLIGQEATKEVIVKTLQVGVSVIHFAAHGSRNGQIFLAPSVSSAKNNIPEEENYILTMKEVQETGIRAQLVVLSCCHSGRGEIKSEGVVAMSRAFLAAGARAVVATLWAVDDSATEVFMLTFYSHLKRKERASKSLQQTIKEMRETRYCDPKYWAAFFLIGDDVTITLEATSSPT